MKSDLMKLRKQLEKELDAKRYEHTLGVAYTASCLAMVHDVSSKDAQIAGLLHDCAKCLSDAKRISICEKNHIEINPTERENPGLLHAKVGAYLAKKDYDVDDEEILDAIRSHTTGRPKMSQLEKIVFIADYIEPGRKVAPRLDEIRKMAFTDLDLALMAILEDTLNYLNERSAAVDPMTRKTYDYYKKHLK